MKKKTLWMIDLEGTLTDNTWRQHLITGENKDWRAYLKGLINDEPIEHIITIARAIHDAPDHEVIVYTTRTQTKYHLENTWRAAHGIQHGWHYLYRESSKLTGPELLRAWCEDLKPQFLIDDRPGNRDAVRDIVPNVYDPKELTDAYFDPESGRISHHQR
jgi:hypothetical protein